MVDLVVGGRLGPLDASALCERVRLLLNARGGATVVCDVGALADPDVGTVDALARLQLTASRLGGEIRLRDSSQELRELLDLAGLRQVVQCGESLPVQPRRKAKEPEEPRRVEEERDPADPTV